MSFNPEGPTECFSFKLSCEERFIIIIIFERNMISCIYDSVCIIHLADMIDNRATIICINLRTNVLANVSIMYVIDFGKKYL